MSLSGASLANRRAFLWECACLSLQRVEGGRWGPEEDPQDRGRSSSHPVPCGCWEKARAAVRGPLRPTGAQTALSPRQGPAGQEGRAFSLWPPSSDPEGTGLTSGSDMLVSSCETPQGTPRHIGGEGAGVLGDWGPG